MVRIRSWGPDEVSICPKGKVMSRRKGTLRKIRRRVNLPFHADNI
jgi:hypothetical protein